MSARNAYTPDSDPPQLYFLTDPTTLQRTNRIHVGLYVRRTARFHCIMSTIRAVHNGRVEGFNPAEIVSSGSLNMDEKNKYNLFLFAY